MGSGASADNGKVAPPPPNAGEAPVQKVDPRLPLQNYRQIHSLKCGWKAVTRALEDTAKENLIRLFKECPHYMEMHSGLKDVSLEDSIRDNEHFENAAVAVFWVIDDVFKNLDNVDKAIRSLKEAGKAHQKVEGFQAEYFKDMEEPFIGAMKITLGDRYKDSTEENLRNMYAFMVKHLTDGYNGS